MDDKNYLLPVNDPKATRRQPYKYINWWHDTILGAWWINAYDMINMIWVSKLIQSLFLIPVQTDSSVDLG